MKRPKIIPSANSNKDYKRRYFMGLLVVVCLLSWQAFVAKGFADSPVTFPLRIETQQGREHFFEVEYADTPKKREIGLMNRTFLAAESGMLFDFQRPQIVHMWMKDTPLSLDMVFIDAAGIIRKIARRTQPFSEKVIASAGWVRYVLEIKGGIPGKLGIRLGDKVRGAVLNK